MPSIVPVVLERLTDAFTARADPGRAAAMAAYMRDKFAFAGVATPERRRLGRAAMQGLPAPTEQELRTIARKCWTRPEREYQYFACDLLRAHDRHRTPEFLAELRFLVTHKSWWDTVDPLSQVVGTLVREHPGLATEMDAWIDEPDFWIARVAILHQLGFGPATDTDRLFDYCARRARDDEFFVRKAIGWALRQYARTNPDAVRAFVAAHAELSPLSRREALRRIG